MCATAVSSMIQIVLTCIRARLAVPFGLIRTWLILPPSTAWMDGRTRGGRWQKLAATAMQARNGTLICGFNLDNGSLARVWAAAAVASGLGFGAVWPEPEPHGNVVIVPHRSGDHATH